VWLEVVRRRGGGRSEKVGRRCVEWSRDRRQESGQAEGTGGGDQGGEDWRGGMRTVVQLSVHAMQS
jgi:hypothetical protein